MKIAKEKVKKAETGFPTNTANLVYIKTGNDASLTEAEVNVTGNAASRTDVLDLKQLTGFDKRDSKKGSTTFVKETTGKEALKHSKVVDMTTVKPLVELESNHFSSNVNSSASTEKSQLVSDISKSYFATENVKPIMTTAVQRPLVSSRGVKKIIGDWDGTLKEGATPIVMFNDVNNREIHKASHHPLFMMDNHVQPFTPLTPSLPFIFPSTPAAVMNRRIEDRQQLPPPILTPATIVLKSSNSFSGEAASSVLSSSFRIQIGNTEANDTNTVSDHSNMPRTEKIIVELSSISRDMENKTASRWLDTKYNHTIEGMVSPLYKSRSFSPGKSTTPYTSSRGEHARSTDGYFSNPGSSGAPNVISYSTQNKSITYVPSLILPGPNEFSDQHAIAKNDKSQNILHLFTIPTNQRSSNTSANPIRYLTANNVPSNILISAPGEFNSNISNDNNSVIAETQSIASLNESIFMYHNISTQRENSSLQLKSENSTYLNNTETTDNTTSDNTTIDPVTLDATAQSNSTDIFDFSSSTEAMTTPEASTVSTIPTPTTPDPDALAEIRELQRVANMYISPTDPNASELKAEAAEAREALS
ncbi:hypothetical protein ACJMK2_020982 [Sinanodonta woodiana]|uniref:Uncharacterized protein n=1 Tax=Sinanodonta woodiana TaxID=1069815 RepID=A0ABD3U0Q6_SINWO